MTIFNHSIKRLASSKLKLVILLVLPVLFALMFVMVNRTSVSIAVADNDKSALSQRLVEDLAAIGNVRLSVVDEKALQDRIVSYQADYALSIGKGFGESILSGRAPDVKEYYILEKEKLFYARETANGVIADMKALAAGAGYDRAKFDRAFAAWQDGGLAVKDASPAEDMTQQSRSALGFLIQFMLYMSVITAGIILEDRSSGVFYRVFFAPVPVGRYLSENLLAFLIVGALQSSLTLFLLRNVLGLELGNQPAMYLLFIVFALVCIALGVWLVSLFKKPLHAYASVMFLTTPLVMLGGCYWPSSYMPDILNKIAKFMPTTWVMQAADKLLSDGVNLGSIGLELLVLLAFAGIFLAAGLVRKVDIAQ